MPAAHKYGSWVVVRPKINQSPETARVHIWCNFKLFVWEGQQVMAANFRVTPSEERKKDGGGGKEGKGEERRGRET